MAFVKKGLGLSVVPDEIAARSDWKSLDLSQNEIKLITVNLSNNALNDLPGDIGTLLSLTSLNVSHNKLHALPDDLWTLSCLKSLYLGHNRLTKIHAGIASLANLQVLDVSHNPELEVIPSEVGWLPLTSLEIQGSPKLKMPKMVIERGFRAVMSYLQVICEQHRLVEEHLDKFASPATEGGQGGGKLTRETLPTDPNDVAALIEARMEAAASTGVVDLRYIGTSATLTRTTELVTVYVADVRDNGWLEVPGALLSLPQMVVLNASDNAIEKVAEGVVPEHLGVLNLSFNKLKVLPAALGKSPVLQQMYLANNLLTDLPGSFSQLPMVDLFLSENPFTTIPQAVCGMKQLAKLSIACCRLEHVPSEISNVTSLRFLDLSFNELSDLPASMEALGSLMALNLSFNPLKTFPDVIVRMTALKELNLDYCAGVTTVPPGIGDLRHLEGLQMEGATLPSPLDAIYAANPIQLMQLARLTGLTALNLARNAIAVIPEELGLLTKLSALNLSDNPLRPPFSTINEFNGELSLVEFCNKLSEKLDLTNCGFEALPEEVKWHSGSLQQLKLANNKLESLPVWISMFTDLTTAVLDNNRLKELPKALLGLPKLTIVMASSNLIKTLPENIGDYSGLQALVLQGNQISSVPVTIGHLSNLKALSLANNRLVSLPDTIGSCSALRLLDVSGNKEITALPRSVGGLSRLKTLKASGNRISTVPGELLQASSCLTEVTFSDNAFVLKKDPKAVLDASDAAGVKRVLAVLIQASKDAPTAGAPADAAAAAVQPAGHPPAGGGSSGMDGTMLVARIDELGADARRPVTPRPPPPDHIPTMESASEAARKAEERTKHDQDLQAIAHQKWLYVQKHIETMAKDPLREKHSTWDSIPLMHVPRIIAAISNPPPPPKLPPGSQSNRRPQAMVRFKRVVQQSSMAMQLLNRVNDALQSSRKDAPQGLANKAAEGAGPSSPSKPAASQPGAPPVPPPRSGASAPPSGAYHPYPPPGYGGYPGYPPLPTAAGPEGTSADLSAGSYPGYPSNESPKKKVGNKLRK